jgi:hypothetical protein
LRAEKGVTTGNMAINIWNIKSIEEGSSWWLFLVGDIGVPGNGRAAVGEVIIIVFLSGHTGRAVDEMDLWVARWGTGRRIYKEVRTVTGRREL